MGLRVLNLGCGRQSSRVYTMMVDGDIEPAEVAIFADTQEEPASVYRTLAQLRKYGADKVPIVTVTRGSLGESLIYGLPGRRRFASDSQMLLDFGGECTGGCGL